MSQALTGDLFRPPAYPGDKPTAADSRRWLFWKVGIDPYGVGFLANPDDVLRAAISNYGETVIAGRAPNGRVESVRELFERTIGAFAQPKVKRGTPKRAGR